MMWTIGLLVVYSVLSLLAGQLIRTPRILAERATWPFLARNALIVAGLSIDTWMPINKKLWTTSFAVFMAGVDFIVLAGCLWLIDGREHHRVARPFVVFGMNAIAMYLLSEFGDVLLSETGWRMAIYDALLAGWLSPNNASLLYALAYTAALFAAAYSMYCKKWFMRA
jgi:predicted acyltransferase